jgi:hypothetical protein
VTVAPTIRPENTARPRSGPSIPVKALEESGYLSEWNVKSILDFGCGYGADVAYLHSRKYDVPGYDPHLKFGRNLVPHKTYDLVLLVFVLNVLPSAAERIDTIRKAASYLKHDAKVFVVARAKADIERQARLRNWGPYADGYISDARKGMFQCGLSQCEMAALLGEAGLTVVTDARVDLRGSIYAIATKL